MIASLDGTTVVDGRSGALGNPTDARVLGALRRAADAVLVGAGTVRAEGYGPARPTAATRAARRARGQDEVPRIAVVTRSLDLDLSTPLFTEPEAPTIVITSASAESRAIEAPCALIAWL